MIMIFVNLFIIISKIFVLIKFLNFSEKRIEWPKMKNQKNQILKVTKNEFRFCLSSKNESFIYHSLYFYQFI